MNRPPQAGNSNNTIDVKELPKQRPSSNFLPQTAFSVQVPLPPPPSSLPAHVRQQLAHSSATPPSHHAVNSATARHISPHTSAPPSTTPAYNQSARHQTPPPPNPRGASPQFANSSPTPKGPPSPTPSLSDSASRNDPVRRVPANNPAAPSAPPRTLPTSTPGTAAAVSTVSASKSAPSVAQQIASSQPNESTMNATGNTNGNRGAPLPPPRASAPSSNTATSPPEAPQRGKRSGSFPEKVQLPPPIGSNNPSPNSSYSSTFVPLPITADMNRARAGTVDSQILRRPPPSTPNSNNASFSSYPSPLSPRANGLKPLPTPTAATVNGALSSKPPAAAVPKRGLPTPTPSSVPTAAPAPSAPPRLSPSPQPPPPNTRPPPPSQPVPATRPVSPQPPPPQRPATNPPSLSASVSKPQPPPSKPPSPRSGANLPPPPRPPARKPMRYQPATPAAAAVPTAPQVAPHSTHSVFSAELIPNAAPITNTYQLGEPLGSGGFAEVVQAKHKQSGRRVAVKIIDKEVTCLADANALKTEIEVLRRLQHPHILRFEEVFDTPNKLYVVTELLDGGELLYQLEGNQEHGALYTENDARRITKQILEATAYLHANFIVHRDLKPENLLFTDKSPTANIKLIDFGLAKSFAPGEMLTDWCGTPEYQPPEMIKRTGYGPKADVWSIGIILYILLAGRPPFRDNNKMRLYSKIIAGDVEFPPEHFGSVSEQAVDLVGKLLSADPNTRYACDEALRHQWIQKGAANAAAPISSMQDLKKFNVTRRFQNTGKQLMTCQRFSLLAKEEAAQDSIARNQFSP